jgi:hypothetical protein
MYTIHNLEVQFEVTGDDRDVFARMFKDHIAEWSGRRDEEGERDRMGAAQRALDDTPEAPPW